MTTQPAAATKLQSAMDSIRFNRAHTLLILLVALGAIFDAIEQFNTGYAAPYIKNVWGITPSQVGLLSSFTFGGMAFGCLISGITGDLIGRRSTYMWNLGLFTFGALICAFSPNIGILYLGRLIVGIGLGGELNTGVTIVSEFVPSKSRGSSTAIVNLAAGGIGTFLSAGIAFTMLGPLIGLFGGPTIAWRWMFGLLVIPALLLFFYRMYIPESPRYLVSRGKIHEANEIISMLGSATLRKKHVVYHEILDTRASEASTDRIAKVPLLDIFRAPLGHRTMAIWVIAWMAFGAEIGITVFLPTVLAGEGFAIVNGLMYAMIINAGGLVGAILSALFAARFNRRSVLGYGALVAIGLSFAFGFSRTALLIVIVGFLLQMVFMLLNTTVWIAAPEMYPTRVRAFGTGAVVLVCQVSGAVMPYVFGKVFGSLGTSGLYILVAGMFAIMAIAVKWALKETRAGSLEELTEDGSASENPANDIRPLTGQA